LASIAQQAATQPSKPAVGGFFVVRAMGPDTDITRSVGMSIGLQHVRSKSAQAGCNGAVSAQQTATFDAAHL